MRKVGKGRYDSATGRRKATVCRSSSRVCSVLSVSIDDGVPELHDDERRRFMAGCAANACGAEEHHSHQQLSATGSTQACQPQTAAGCSTHHHAEDDDRCPVKHAGCKDNSMQQNVLQHSKHQGRAVMLGRLQFDMLCLALKALHEHICNCVQASAVNSLQHQIRGQRFQLTVNEEEDP